MNIAVTIYGDTTSDDATTETDDLQIPVIASISTSQHPPQSPVRINGAVEKNRSIY